MSIEWDPAKAAANRLNHGVAFEEAAAVFFDPLAVTQEDPDHSIDEGRFPIVGYSARERILVVSYTCRETVFESSVRDPRRRAKERLMKKGLRDDDEMRPEYDFEALGPGVRGEHCARLMAKSNVVRIAPDLTKAFPNERAVNGALRHLPEIAQRNVPTRRKRAAR